MRLLDVSIGGHDHSALLPIAHALPSPAHQAKLNIRRYRIAGIERMKTRLGTHRFQRADFGDNSLGNQYALSPCPHAGSDAYPGIFQGETSYD
jgi:hypothetical protein